MKDTQELVLRYCLNYYTVHTLGVYVHYLEHNIDLFSQWVGVDQGQLERNCVGVEERAGLHKQTQ